MQRPTCCIQSSCEREAKTAVDAANSTLDLTSYLLLVISNSIQKKMHTFSFSWKKRKTDAHDFYLLRARSNSDKSIRSDQQDSNPFF